MSKKLSDVTAAAQAFVHSSNPMDQMFVVNFNEKVSLGLPLKMRFSDSVYQLGGAIGGAPAIGTTALYDAIVEALKQLQEGTSDKKVLVVISDGGDNASKATLDRVLKMTLFVADINLWEAVNKVYSRILGENRPARAVIPTGPLHYGFLIEIEAVAAVGT